MRTFVGAIIENPVYGFLLQKRDYTPGIPFQGLWTLFGGRVDEGESSEQALFRELREELQFKKENALICRVVQENELDDGNRQFIYHVVTNAKIGDLVLKEGETFGYFNKSDVLNRDFAFNIKEVLESFFSTN